jgi:acyl carrier protein
VTSAIDGDGIKYLCAYYVAEPAVAAAALRKHLGGRLPGYMVPSYFCQLDRMPLAQSGKVDLRKLPAPQPSADPEQSAGTGPLSDVERSVARIWAELLEVPSVGAHDNFFEIGGHSLKAGSLVSRMRAEFGVDLSLRMVFDFPTVAELAALIADRSGKECRDGVTA